MNARDLFYYVRSKIDFSIKGLLSHGRIKVGKNCLARRGLIILLGSKEARISIGDNCFFNNYCSINSLEKVSIGDDCTFGEGVRFYDHDHDFRNLTGSPFISPPIVIGNGCWFGSNVLVLRGVTIGDNVVVAAGTILTKDVPSGTVVRNKTELEMKQYQRVACHG